MRAPIFSDNKIKNRERKRERKNHLHKIWWLRIFELNWCVSISTFDNHFFFLSKLFVCYFGVCSFGFRISFSLLCVFFFFARWDEVFPSLDLFAIFGDKDRSYGCPGHFEMGNITIFFNVIKRMLVFSLLISFIRTLFSNLLRDEHWLRHSNQNW